MKAIVVHAVEDAMVVPRSLARRRYQPSQGAFNGPPPLDNLEALGLVRTPDDLNRPASRSGEGTKELVAGM